MLSFIKITYIIIGHVLINQSTASRISINKNSNVTRNWLENLEKSNSKFFDKRSSLEFICNYNGSGVFSPVCCETTFLLGVVGDSVEQSTKAFVKKHTEEPSYNLGYISARGIMKVCIHSRREFRFIS
ncbi:hypothetical protein PAEPH01_1223 [Pancytospora epiphaga]|nr:hypothetical protein PAEPH01_1223 [Pancytospora epiphaga]